MPISEIKDMVVAGGGVLIVLMTFVQITPYQGKSVVLGRQNIWQTAQGVWTCYQFRRSH